MSADDALASPVTPKPTIPSISSCEKKGASDPRSLAASDSGLTDAADEAPTTPKASPRLSASRPRVQRPKNMNLPADEDVYSVIADSPRGGLERDMVKQPRTQSSLEEHGIPRDTAAPRYNRGDTAVSSCESNSRYDSNRLEGSSSGLTHVVDVSDKAICSSEMMYMARCFEAVIQRLDMNLRYTKAVYRSTKKSLIGPGFETTSVFQRRDSFMSHRGSDASCMTPANPFGSVPLAPFLPPYLPEPRTGGALQEPRTGAPAFRNSTTTCSFASSPERAHPTPSTESPAKEKIHFARAQSGNSNSNSTVWSRSMSFETFGATTIGGPPADKHADNSYSHLQSLPEESYESEQADAVPSRPRVRPSTMHEVTRALAQQNRYHELRTAKIWRFMEDRTSGAFALAYFRGRMLLIALSVFAACFQVIEVAETSHWKPQSDGVVGFAIQISFEALFALELGVRFYVCPNRPLFLLSLYNFIDLFSIFPCAVRLPAYIGIEESQDIVVALFGLVPVLRLLKVLRHFETFHLLLNAFVSAGC